MEVIIVLVVVVGIIGCLLYFRSREASKIAPVEEANAWPIAEPTVPVAAVSEPVVEKPVTVETSTVVETPVEQPEVVAKPKKARAKKATVDTTTTEEPKPAAKPRARKPKMTVAK